MQGHGEALSGADPAVQPGRPQAFVRSVMKGQFWEKIAPKLVAFLAGHYATSQLMRGYGECY